MSDKLSLYENLIDIAAHPSGQGLLTESDALVDNTLSSCGDQVKISIQLDEKLRLKAVGWEGEGCVVSRAALSVLVEHAIGLTAEQIAALDLDSIKQWLGLHELSAGRQHCAMIGLKTLQQAVVQAVQKKKP